MTGWLLIHFPRDAGAHSLAGYSVQDALGVRIGEVLGWVVDERDTVQLLKVSVRDWVDQQTFLVPLGAVSTIDDDRRQLRLHQLTRAALQRECLTVQDALPPAETLEDLITQFPNPRPSVFERLQEPYQVPQRPSPGRLTIRHGQGDGHPHPAEEAPRLTPRPERPAWAKLIKLLSPPWRPLVNFLRP